MLSASVVAMARRSASRRSAAATAAAYVALSARSAVAFVPQGSFVVESTPVVAPFSPAFLVPSSVDRRPFSSRTAIVPNGGSLLMSTAGVVVEDTLTPVKDSADNDRDQGRPVASGPVLRFSPGRGGLGGVAAVRLREGDVGVVEEADDSAPGMFGKPKGYEAKGGKEEKEKKGDDFVGRSVLFPDGRSGVVVAERPPIAFVLCDFDKLDESGVAAEDGVKSLGEASVLDSMATVEVSDALLGKVLDWRGREIAVGEDGTTSPTVTAANGESKSAISHRRAIFAPIPQVKDIALINEPMLTGSAVVDALAPLGKGQNMLLIGQKGTGKSALATGAVASQIRAVKDEAQKEGKRGVRCVYALTSSTESERAEAILRLEKAGVREDAIVVSARGSSIDDDELQSAEAVAVAAAACAIGEAFALSEGYDSLVIVDDIDQHKALWDWTTRLLVDVYGVDAVVKDDRDGGASSEMRGYYSSLIQRAGKYNAYNGGGSVTLMMLASVPGAKDDDEDGAVFKPEDFDGASQKVKDRISILVNKGIPLTPATLRKIQIPVPSACESENERKLALQHADDLISMSDGQIWLDADLLKNEGRMPPIDPQRSITRVGIGADTESRADAPAVRGLTGGLRFELAQAVDSMGGSASTKADEKQLVRRDAWLLAMHQKPGDIRNLSENVVVLLAAKIGQLDDAVRGGSKAGTKEGDEVIAGMIEFVRTSAPGAMDEVDDTEDLSEGGRGALEEAIRSYFELSSST